ncbi:MAG: hypothetical protein SNJ75_17850, partial [Gemmataceae bacterium]
MLTILALMLSVGLCVGVWLSVRTARRGWLVVHPSWRERLHNADLLHAADLLALPEEVVSGHTNRRVSRVKLCGQTMYLKREERVRWGSAAYLAARDGERVLRTRLGPEAHI